MCPGKWCIIVPVLEDIIWVGGGEENELVSEFCLGLTLSNPHTTKLASKEGDGTRHSGAHMFSGKCGTNELQNEAESLPLHAPRSQLGIPSSPPGSRRRARVCTGKQLSLKHCHKHSLGPVPGQRA